MILAVIPARAGSKGLPGKNVKPLLGKPLIAWSIEAALGAASVDEVVVSSDSDDILAIAASFGSGIDKRPAELATDGAKTIDVLTELAGRRPDVDTFVLLQPTSPLRGKGLIDACVAEFQAGGYDDLATGFWCKYQAFGSHNNLPRQETQGFFYDDGNVYVLSRKIVEQRKWFGDNICRKVIDRWMNYEIDDEVDWVVLEALMARYGNEVASARA